MYRTRLLPVCASGMALLLLSVLTSGACASPTKHNEAVLRADKLFNEGKFLDSLVLLNQILNKDPRETHALWLRGLVYETTKKPADAIRNYDAFLSIQPDNIEVIKHKAFSYMALGDKQKAFQQAETVIKLAPKSPDSYVTASMLHRIANEFSEALSICNEGMKKSKANAPLYIDRGYSDERLRRYKDCISDADKALRLRPGNIEAYRLKGVSLSAMGNHREAIDNFNEAIKRSPDNPHAYFARAVCYYQTRQYKLAQGDANKLLSLNAFPAAAHGILITSYMDSTKAPSKGFFSQAGNDACAAATRWIMKEPWNPDAYADRAEINFRRQRYDEALQDVAIGLSKSPNNQRILRLKYEIDLADAGCNNAAQDLEQLKKVSPGDSYNFYLHGRYKLLHGHAAEAIKCLSEAIKRSPKIGEYYLERADAYSVDGWPDKALADLDEAKRLGIKSGLVTYKRAAVLQKANRSEEAMKEFRICLQAPAPPPRAYIAYATLLANAGKVQESIKFVSDILARHPDSEEMFLFRADLYKRLGKYDMAISDYSQVIKEKPFCFDAYRRRAEAFDKLGKTAQAQSDRRVYKKEIERSTAIFDSGKLITRLSKFE